MGFLGAFIWSLMYALYRFSAIPYSLYNSVGRPSMALHAITTVAGLLNVSLMWLEVAKTSKTLKKAGTNLGPIKYAVMVTMLLMALFAIYLMVWMPALLVMLTTIGSAIVGPAYVCGGMKLGKVLGGGSDGSSAKTTRLGAIRKAARRIGIACLGLVVVSLLGLVAGAIQNTVMWGVILILNLTAVQFAHTCITDYLGEGKKKSAVAGENGDASSSGWASSAASSAGRLSTAQNPRSSTGSGPVSSVQD